MSRTSNEYENEFWPKNQLILGIDEAGRGPICGPLVVAGCILPVGYDTDLIYDSKKLSAKKRQEACLMIKKDALYFDVQIVSNKRIDELNIYQATKKAMTKIAQRAACNIVITDAMPLDLNKTVFPLVKGDMKSINVAAASIIAKEIRDKIMLMYDRLYPEYELAKHKGYPTKRHLELLGQYGLQDFYRLSYGPCKTLSDLTLF